MTEPSDNPVGDVLARGGGETAFSENVDFSKPEDVAIARRLLLRHGKRWPILAEERARMVERLIAAAEGGSEFAERLLTDMEKANQADEIHRDKNKRLDQGLPTENMTFVVKPPRVIGE